MWPFTRKKWEKLGATFTRDAFEQQARALKPTPYYVFPRDKDIRAIPHTDFEQLMFDCWFPKDYRDYAPEIWDCDNYAVACMAKIQERWAKVSKGKQAIAFGYIAATVEGMGHHAFIWHMDHKGVFRFYEPQTGKRVDYDLTMNYLMEL